MTDDDSGEGEGDRETVREGGDRETVREDRESRDRDDRETVREERGAGPFARAQLIDPLDRAIAKAKTRAALFGGEAEAVKVGRYRLLERVGAGGMGVVWAAFDPELDRSVALKLASAGTAEDRARVREEGKALAKLSHPNVVPIFDVLDAPEGVFLVMELVHGDTLRAFAAAPAATVATIVRAYRQAGEGLAAAHRAGLVHHDFKPDNAIVGADGRVRVLDFGLAHAEGAELGGVAGTPRYMAPEQARGEPVTAAVDQYAFAVSLREALAGGGRGDVGGRPGGVPRWLEPVLARGAAARAEDRYPSLEALLRAIALDPATRWKRRALGGALALGVVGAVAAFAIGRARRGPEPCTGGAALIADSWHGSPHLAAFGGAYAKEAVPRIAGALDGYAATWAGEHRAACEAHARGELSEAALDRRSACLTTRQVALATVARATEAGGPGDLAKLVTAAASLPDLATCADDAALLSPVAPPPAAQAAEVRAVDELLARAGALRDADDIAAATRDADAALTRATALGYAPLRARALLARGRIDLALYRGDRGAAMFEEASHLAVAAGDQPLAVEAYARGAFAIGTSGDAGNATRALDGLPLVEAMATHVPAFPRALLENNVGGIELARGERPAARARFVQARTEARDLTGAPAIELTIVLWNLLVATDDAAALPAIAGELVAARTNLVGGLHPDTLEARITAAEIIDDVDHLGTDLGQPCGQLAELHPDHAQIIGECSAEVARGALVAGDATTAKAFVARALVAVLPDDGMRPIVVAEERLLAGDRAGALASLATVPAPAPDASWWEEAIAVDSAIVSALASDRPTAALAAAEAHLAKAAPAMPAASVGRRRSQIATLRARGR